MLIGPAMMWVAHTAPTTPGMPRQADADVAPWWETVGGGKRLENSKQPAPHSFSGQMGSESTLSHRLPHGVHFLSFPYPVSSREGAGALRWEGGLNSPHLATTRAHLPFWIRGCITYPLWVLALIIPQDGRS